MDINKNMVILWVCLAAILIIENMVTGYQAYTFIWTTKAWMLAFCGAGTGVLIWFWLRWMVSSQKKDSDENYDF